MEEASSHRNPDKSPIESFPNAHASENFRTAQSTGHIRSHKSTGNSSPDSSITNGADVDIEALSQRQKEKPHWIQRTWIGTLVILIVLSFLVLFTSFAEDIRHGNIKLPDKVSLKSFSKPDSFHPCEDVGLANPSCSEIEPLHEKPAHKVDKRLALDWVSSKPPPPGFEHWLKFAEENQCQMGSYTRIEKDLEAFRDASTGKIRILRHHVDGAQAMTDTARFKIKDGAVTHVAAGLFEFRETWVDLLSRFVQYLPDMEFVANYMDEPRVLPGDTDDVDERMASPVCRNASESFTKYRHLHGFINNRQHGPRYDPNKELVALFSQTKVNECFRDIVFPTLYNLASNLPPEDEDALKPWEERDEVLFFRGSTTGGMFTDPAMEGISHRQRLVKYAKDKPSMDIGFTSFIQCSQEVCSQMDAEYGYANSVPYMENFDHKYLMSIDGNSFVSRLPRFMQSASLIFRAGIFDEWFEEWIHDKEHYLRVALDYSDLDERVQWAKTHDKEAKAMGLKAREFSKKHLRKQDMECYIFRLLLEYADVLEL